MNTSKLPTKTFDKNQKQRCRKDMKLRIKKWPCDANISLLYKRSIGKQKNQHVKVGHRYTRKAHFNRLGIVSVWLCTYLKLLQSTCNERLTRCLLPAESEHILHGLLEGLPLSDQVSRLHHDEEQVVHLEADPDV